MAGWEGVPEVHAYAVNKGQLGVGKVLGKPGDGTRGIDDMFAYLRQQGGEEHGRRGKYAVSYFGEEQQGHAYDIGKPLCEGGIIPIKYIARVRVTVAKQ